MKNKERRACDIPEIIFQTPSRTFSTAQCDCAFPPLDITLNTDFPLPNLHNAAFHTTPALISQSIDSRYYALLSPYTYHLSVLNKHTLGFLQHFSSPQILENIPSFWKELWGESALQSTVEQMINNSLLIPKGSRLTLEKKETSDTLTVSLHITDRCNLGCVYCYFPHNDVVMSPGIGRAAIDATFRSANHHNYHTINLKYSGGEPLLRFGLIPQLHRYARALADQHKITLDGIILSNGTLLTREIIRTIQNLELRLMISLDNLYPSSFQVVRELVHLPSIPQRIYPNGRDASHDAMQAIELALDCGLVPDISITVSGQNLESLPELLEWVLERDLPFSLNFYRKHENTADGLFADHKRDVCETALAIKEDRFIARMLAAYKVVEANLPRRSLLAALIDRANLAVPHLRPCSAGHNYLVIDPLGHITKCQMQREQPVTTVEASDPLEMIRANKKSPQNISVEEKEGCTRCQWKYFCTGGCPIETFKAAGRYDLKSPHCEIYKALYPEVLRLEGLRMLKYNTSEQTIHQADSKRS